MAKRQQPLTFLAHQGEHAVVSKVFHPKPFIAICVGNRFPGNVATHLVGTASEIHLFFFRVRHQFVTHGPVVRTFPRHLALDARRLKASGTVPSAACVTDFEGSPIASKPPEPSGIDLANNTRSIK
jgi:hypothetical protein